MAEKVKGWTSRDARKQSEIIHNWLKETQEAYNKEDVSDSEIIAYLAQKELGYHKEVLSKK